MKAALPANEAERLQALHAYAILDTLPESGYQDIVQLASLICGTPIALVSLVDRHRQWFKAKIGLDALQTERDVAFCAHALNNPDELLVVPDTSQDARFFDNPLVTGDLRIGFYAGAPLRTESGLVLGTLCVIDHASRVLSEAQQEALAALARQVMAHLELRHKVAQIEETQSQLMQAEKMAAIGQLAAGVAHEINNPLGFVQSNLNTLSKYSATLFDVIDRSRGILEQASRVPAPMEAFTGLVQEVDLAYLRTDMPELVRQSRDGLERVQGIVDALRSFSHVGEAAWQLADLHEGIDSTLKIAASTLRRKAEVVRDYGDLPLVECLVSQINQVLMNLLVNATQAIAQRGVISIRTRWEDDWVSIAVTDTGNGIAPDHLPFIFDPFFTTKPVGLGTGLGLSISYNIVNKHGGRIDVDSRLGVGTTLTLWLPVRRAD